VTPGKPGTNQIHVTFFDARGNEAPQADVKVTATPPSGRAPALRVLRFSPGHVAAQGELGPGRWTFDIAATARDGTASTARFEQAIGK